MVRKLVFQCLHRGAFLAPVLLKSRGGLASGKVGSRHLVQILWQVSFLPFFLYFFLNTYLFIWLRWVLVVACGIFRCGAWASL